MQELHRISSSESNIMRFIAEHPRVLTSGLEFIQPLSKKFACDLITLYKLNTSGLLELIAYQGHIPAELLGAIQIIPVGKGMAGLAAERKQAVATCNLQNDQSPDIRARAKETMMRGAIAIPIVIDGTVKGVIGLAAQSAREFSAPEIDFVSRIGSLFFLDGRGLPQESPGKRSVSN